METNELLPREIAELEEESDALLAATVEFEQAAKHLDLENWIVHRLRQSEREISLNLPVNREGEVSAAGAIRVQHHSGGHATLGPVHLSRDVHPHLVRAAAMDATWQLSLLDLPFGGAAGAVWCDPAEINERDLRDLVRSYVHGLRGIAGPFSDVLTPGMGCNEQVMAWMAGYELQGDPRAVAAVVGKPAGFWGLPDHHSGAAIGIAALARQLLEQTSTDRSRKSALARISIQGFGTTGSAVAGLLQKSVRLVAAADASGGLHNMGGLDVAALQAHLEHKGVLFGYAAAEPICNADVLECECDVLVLAATERQITTTNAGRIRATLVIEAARGAVTRAAEEILDARGIKVIPYLVATAGAFVMAYLEWAQNTYCIRTSEIEMNEAVATRLRALQEHISAASEQYHTTPRRAALLVAVRRIAEQVRLTGRDS